MKHIIALVVAAVLSTTAFAGPGELRGGSQYEYKLVTLFPQLIGYGFTGGSW